MAQRKGGVIQVQIGGVSVDCKGAFTYNLGEEMRTTIMGVDGPHGYSGKRQSAFIEGEITDRVNLNLSNFVNMDGDTVTLTLANGKVITLRDAWFAGDGSAETDEGAIKVRFESRSKAQET